MKNFSHAHAFPMFKGLSVEASVSQSSCFKMEYYELFFLLPQRSLE